MPDAGSERFSPEQRLYVHTKLAADRLAAKLEADERQIEADPDSNAESLAKLRESVRLYERALASYEATILRDEGPPMGEFFARVAAAVAEEEAEGVDVPTKAREELLHEATEGSTDILPFESCARCQRGDVTTGIALEGDREWIVAALAQIGVPEERARGLVDQSDPSGVLDNLLSINTETGEATLVVGVRLCPNCAALYGIELGDVPRLPVSSQSAAEGQG